MIRGCFLWNTRFEGLESHPWQSQPLTAATLAALRDEHARSIAPARQQATEALQLERTLSDLINQAYGLTPDEVKLMWATAPPRMLFPAP